MFYTRWRVTQWNQEAFLEEVTPELSTEGRVARKAEVRRGVKGGVLTDGISWKRMGEM